MLLFLFVRQGCRSARIELYLKNEGSIICSTIDGPCKIYVADSYKHVGTFLLPNGSLSKEVLALRRLKHRNLLDVRKKRKLQNKAKNLKDMQKVTTAL